MALYFLDSSAIVNYESQFKKIQSRKVLQNSASSLRS
jgi:hypothetical protein